MQLIKVKVIELLKLKTCFFLSNLPAYECEILFEAFMHRENEILFMKSGLRAQHGCHAHKCSKICFSLQNRWADIPEIWYLASGTLAHHS